MVELLHGVHDRTPFRDGLAGEQGVELRDQRRQFGRTLRAGLHLGDDPGVFLTSRPVAVARRVDGDHRVTALGREAVGARHDAGSLLVPRRCPIRISGRDPTAPSGVHRTPGISPRVNSCSVTPSDDVREVKCIACQASRDAFCGHSLGLTRQGAPTCHSVDRSHLLGLQHHAARRTYHNVLVRRRPWVCSHVCETW
jgi:hypothetical protein